jgi:hypothetical protein
MLNKTKKSERVSRFIKEQNEFETGIGEDETLEVYKQTVTCTCPNCGETLEIEIDQDDDGEHDTDIPETEENMGDTNDDELEVDSDTYADLEDDDSEIDDYDDEEDDGPYFS